MKEKLSRRNFLGTSAGFAAAGFAAVANPIAAAAQTVGVKSTDLPDLTIKEVKAYVVDLSNIPHLNNSSETGEIISVVTNSGIEGNYTLGNRGVTAGWVDWAKPMLVGKSVVDLLPVIASTSGMMGPGGYDTSTRRMPPPRMPAPGAPGTGARPAGPPMQGMGGFGHGGATWPNFYTAAADVCMWDILGKAVNRPIYKILSGGTPTKDKLMAYASSQHLPSIEDYVPDVLKAKELGYRGYKIHPGGGQHKTGTPIPSYIGHMEEIKQVRAAVGDEFMLAHDPVQQYDREEALAVGHLLDDLNYLWFEDPVRTTDIEGLIKICSELRLAIHVGEFITSISDFAEYIKRDALTVVRLIADNVGGISGSMRVGLLADAHGMECTPHNWGNGFDLALHFHLELALPNAWWFEMPWPQESADRAYFKTPFRIDADGYVHAPTEPGLGYPLDRDALDKMTLRIER
jgi:L-alanine-DL-glutamate epimerase-like enolase superfamily enzyme